MLCQPNKLKLNQNIQRPGQIVIDVLLIDLTATYSLFLRSTFSISIWVKVIPSFFQVCKPS
ncbi:hypothetical protein, partial [Acinetobacter baumannii]|uniref:hypothetical protein n=1 Tax=Acinetobacter baumannii TaxID=470 RepID=UPI001BB2DBF6